VARVDSTVEDRLFAHDGEVVGLDVTIIVVSYNTREMTLACLNSVIEQTHSVRYEIIVVDNCSTDGSAEAIRSAYPAVKLIQPGQNLGFACANNLAARSSKAKRLLLLNPDTLILDGAIDRLIDFAEETPNLGIWGGRTVFADGRLNPHSCWRQMTIWSIFCSLVGLSLFRNSAIFYSDGYGGWPRDTVRSVDIVTGCFFLVDRDLWQRLSGFDPVFFMYAEEADLCLRAAKLGARPTVTPTATIVHYGGASEKNRTDKTIKMLAGKVTLMRRHWSPEKFMVGRLLLLLQALTRWGAISTAASLLNRSEWRRRADVWRGVWRARDRWSNGWPERLQEETRISLT
jgi:GT2 family glycosyltransferase